MSINTCIGLYIFCFLLLGETNCEIYNYRIHAEDAINEESYVLWPNGTIPYFIAEGHFDKEQLKAIDDMIKKFELLTCLKFEMTAFDPPETDHVLHFRNPDGVRRCTHSPWGHSVDEPHHVTLGYDCLKSPHLDMMFMKALGFPFEHNRASRDIYIDVQPENVERMYMEHFAKDPRHGPKLRLLEYDVNSAMHFGPYEYSKNGHRTIIFKKKQVQNRVGLSKMDIKKIELVYGPECRKRGRMQKMDECQSYPTQRKKRSIFSYPRKSLRVNPEITPPPILSPIDSSELIEHNISDIVKQITHHVHIVSGLIVKKARVQHCNASTNEVIDNSNDEQIKDVVTKIEAHAKSILERAQSNPEGFCNDKNILRSCGLGYQGQKEFCPPGYKSTKFGQVRHSTQHRPTLQYSTQHQSRNEKKRDYLPYPMGREGNFSDNSLVTEKSILNATKAVNVKEKDVNIHKIEKRDTRNEIENAELDANEDSNNDKINEEAAPSRRLVKKFRSKATPTTAQTSIETKNAETTTTVASSTGDPNANDDATDVLKAKAEDEEEEYEEVEENDEDESATSKKPVPKASPARQKRFKKKTVQRPSADNREQDTANFDQNQQQKEQNSQKPSAVKKKPHESPQKGKPKKVFASKKKEPEVVENESSGEEYTEDEAAGVKNVKVIMEYNTAASNSYATPAQARYPPAQESVPENVQEGENQEQIARQDEESESGSDENQLPEEIQEEDDGEEAEGIAVQQQEIVQEQQPDTPSPAFEEQLQQAAVPQKKKKRKPARSDEEEDTGMVIDSRIPIKQHKKPKLIKPSKSVKGPKNRIVGPGIPNQGYQPSVPPSIPRTIKLNKKNLEFYNERKWNDAIVPYVIAEYKQYNTDDLRRRLGEVIKILKRKTCVRLLEVTMQEAEDSYEDYLVLDTSPDYVTGRVGGKQRFGSVELFEGGQHRQHAAMMVMAMLGFYFEVARHDRDRYVRVHLRHVRADKLHHFEKIRDDATFPLPYDYKSATHPAWQFWRKLGKKGISTVATYKESDPSGVLMKSLGQNPELLSEYDIMKINTIYGVDCFYKSGLIRDA